jgi:hypothetical protein
MSSVREYDELINVTIQKHEKLLGATSSEINDEFKKLFYQGLELCQRNYTDYIKSLLVCLEYINNKNVEIITNILILILNHNDKESLELLFKIVEQSEILKQSINHLSNENFNTLIDLIDKKHHIVFEVLLHKIKNPRTLYRDIRRTSISYDKELLIKYLSTADTNLSILLNEESRLLDAYNNNYDIVINILDEIELNYHNRYNKFTEIIDEQDNEIEKKRLMEEAHIILGYSVLIENTIKILKEKKIMRERHNLMNRRRETDENQPPIIGGNLFTIRLINAYNNYLINN